MTLPSTTYHHLADFDRASSCTVSRHEEGKLKDKMGARTRASQRPRRRPAGSCSRDSSNHRGCSVPCRVTRRYAYPYRSTEPSQETVPASRTLTGELIPHTGLSCGHLRRAQREEYRASSARSPVVITCHAKRRSAHLRGDQVGTNDLMHPEACAQEIMLETQELRQLKEQRLWQFQKGVAARVGAFEALRRGALVDFGVSAAHEEAKAIHNNSDYHDCVEKNIKVVSPVKAGYWKKLEGEGILAAEKHSVIPEHTGYARALLATRRQDKPLDEVVPGRLWSSDADIAEMLDAFEAEGAIRAPRCPLAEEGACDSRQLPLSGGGRRRRVDEGATCDDTSGDDVSESDANSDLDDFGECDGVLLADDDAMPPFQQRLRTLIRKRVAKAKGRRQNQKSTAATTSTQETPLVHLCQQEVTTESSRAVPSCHLVGSCDCGSHNPEAAVKKSCRPSPSHGLPPQHEAVLDPSRRKLYLDTIRSSHEYLEEAKRARQHHFRIQRQLFMDRERASVREKRQQARHSAKMELRKQLQEESRLCHEQAMRAFIAQQMQQPSSRCSGDSN